MSTPMSHGYLCCYHHSRVLNFTTDVVLKQHLYVPYLCSLMTLKTTFKDGFIACIRGTAACRTYQLCLNAVCGHYHHHCTSIGYSQA